MRSSLVVLGCLLSVRYSSISVAAPSLTEREKQRDEESKIETIIAPLGGATYFGCTWVDGLYVILGNEKLTDTGLEHLNGVIQIKGLELYAPKVTDAGLKHLSGLSNLLMLHLECNKATDKGLEHLKGLTRLKSLYLGHTQVTDAGLKYLQGMSRLRELDLEYTQVTGPGLEYLKDLKQLEDLNLDHTPITDDALGHLKGLTNLQRLWLGYTMITGNGLVNLKGLSQLESLGLDGTLMRDAGLEQLKGLTQLKSLTLGYTATTAKGLSDLRSALPGRLHDNFLSEGDNLLRKKEYGKAIAAFQEAIKFNPKSAIPYNQLAWMLATCPDARYRDGKTAVESAKRAYQLDRGRDWIILATLGEAYGENGEFAVAITWEKKALGLAVDEKDKETCRSRLRVFEQGKPYHEAP